MADLYVQVQNALASGLWGGGRVWDVHSLTHPTESYGSGSSSRRQSSRGGLKMSS